MKCVQMSWMVILVGPASVGKTSLVQLLAQLTGHTLKIMAMNSAMDTTELLGGFEQVIVQLVVFLVDGDYKKQQSLALANVYHKFTCSGYFRLTLYGPGGSC